MFQPVYQLSAVGKSPVLRASFFEPVALAGLVFLLLTVLAILGLFSRVSSVPPSGRSKVSIAGWGFGFIMPGTARQFSFLGPLLTTAFVFSAMARYNLHISDGVATNLLDAIATANFTNLYGIGEILYTPLESFIRRMASLWWVLWGVNLLVVMLFERFSPDPCGLRGETGISQTENSGS